MLKLYNVLTRKKEEFQSIEPNKVRMYACGITVSGDAHIGHAYQSIVFDMIRRYLEFKGYQVNYVRNYTDVDDKIIARANEKGVDPMDYAKELMKKTDSELAELGSAPPTVMARATESIPDIIHFVERLIDKGFAYVTGEGDVYYRVAAFKDYGKLSRINREENLSGVRKQLEDDKHETEDFALWKRAKPGEIFWNSPWGAGRPGWHIECSTMSMKYLGDTIDIHGGGRDLIFPHHENEIAQSEALTGNTFSNYWIHNGLIKINGQKMSKSLGNGILLQDLLRDYQPDVIRFSLLRALYSSDINVTDDMFDEAAKHLYKIYKLFAKIPMEESTVVSNQTQEYIHQMEREFIAAMDDDFNTAIAFSLLFKWVDLLSVELMKKTSVYNLAAIKGKIKQLFSVFNLLQKNEVEFVSAIQQKHLIKNDISVDFISEKIAERTVHKNDKNYQAADGVRDELLKKGILLQDSPQGVLWDIDL